MADVDYDVVIVGAGPAGYVAAIRAAQLGLKTAVVERDEVGGICLNWGCIPTKSLLRNAEVLSLFRRADEWGVQCRIEGVDYSRAFTRSRQVVERLVKGVHYLFRKNKVALVKGEAVLRSPSQVEVKDTGQVLRARHIMVATGARPRTLPALPVDGRLVITSREALEQKELPSSVVIVGGGAVGVEFAYLYNAYGVPVTIVELLPHLLPMEDEEVSAHLERSFQKQGIKFHTSAKVTAMEPFEGGARLTLETPNGTTRVEAGQVLVAVGVEPNSQGLGLEELGVALDRGFIQVDEHLRTNVPGVYAAGDVTGKLLLAHVGSAQGVTAVEAMAGREPRPLDYKLMPRAVYCRPQVTSFGITEREAKEAGLDYRVGKFPFSANGKALGQGEAEGFVKVLVDARYGEILGAHLIGPDVTELLPEIALTRLLEGTVEELGWLVHSHPTLSEAVKEAALGALEQAIHI